MVKVFVLMILGLTLSVTSMAKTLLDCSDLSTSDGYFPARVQLIEIDSKLQVKFVNCKIVTALTGVSSSTSQVLKSEQVGFTDSYVLEQNTDGVASITLVADLKTKQATMLYFTDINKTMVQFLKCK